MVARATLRSAAAMARGERQGEGVRAEGEQGMADDQVEREVRCRDDRDVRGGSAGGSAPSGGQGLEPGRSFLEKIKEKLQKMHEMTGQLIKDLEEVGVNKLRKVKENQIEFAQTSTDTNKPSAKERQWEPLPPSNGGDGDGRRRWTRTTR